MYVTVVYVKVKPDHVQDFIQESILNHNSSIEEKGNLRFDVLQSIEDPCDFILYEAYETAEDAASHKNTLHYLRWKEVVADWMAEPRRGVVYTSIVP